MGEAEERPRPPWPFERFPQRADWVELARFYDFLKPFYILTKPMEGNASTPDAEGGHGAVWETIKTTDYLLVKIQAGCVEHPVRGSLPFQVGD